MPAEKAILIQPIIVILERFSSTPLKQDPTDSWKAKATGIVSDIPMVNGDESRDEQSDIGVIRKSLDKEIILSARDIIPFIVIDDVDDVCDLYSWCWGSGVGCWGLKTLNEFVLNEEAEVDLAIKHDKFKEFEVVVKIDPDIDDGTDAEWQFVSELLGGNGRTLNVDEVGVVVSDASIGSSSLVFSAVLVVSDNSLKAA